MFVTVIHRIHDPEGFQAAEAKALEAGLPAHVALPIHAGDQRSRTRHLLLGRRIGRRRARGSVMDGRSDAPLAVHVDGGTCPTSDWRFISWSAE